MDEVITTEVPESASADVDVDALMTQIEAGEEVNPGYERDSVEQVDGRAQTAPVPEQTAIEFELNGQKFGKDQLLELAKGGLEYQTTRETLSKAQKDYETQQAALSRYKEIDDFAAKNPEWWNHVANNYQQAQAPKTPEIPEELKAHLEPILKDYQSMKQFMTDFQRDKIETQTRAADAQYKETLSSLQKTYGIDFHARDAAGQSLEQRVLDHAKQRGISNMEAAYRDYDFANIVARSEAKGREAVANEYKSNTKLGLLKGQPPAPSFDFDFNSAANEERAPTSWNDAYNGALEDLRSMQRA